MSNIVLPDNQVVFNTPLFQQNLRQDPKFGDENARVGGIASDPSVYLVRLLNNSLQSMGRDCVIKDLIVDVNAGIETRTIEFKVNPGLFIKDSTLLELKEEVLVDNQLDPLDTSDHFIVGLNYEFSEEVEENLFNITCSLWDSNTEIISDDGFSGGLILGLFEVLRDTNMNIVALEDKTLSRFDGYPHPPINLKDSIGDPLGIGHVHPQPEPIKKIYHSLLQRGVVSPYKMFKRETSGEQIHRVPSLEVLNAFGSEDQVGGFHIGITTALIEDPALYTHTFEIHDVPTGVTFTHGIDRGNGIWDIDPVDLPNIHLNPIPNSDVDFTLRVFSISTEDAIPENTAYSEDTIIVTIFAEADNPTLSVEDAVATDIGTPIDVTINAALTDTDGSEVMSIEIQNVPQDGTIFNQGTDNGDGTWTFSPAELTGLTITPFDWDVDFVINVIATATEQSNQTTSGVNAPLTVSVKPNVEITVSNASGDEDLEIPMNIDVSLVDTNGFDLTVEISGVPTGATLNTGTDQGGGVWDVDPSNLSSITITPPLNSSNNFQLNIKGTSTPTGLGNVSYRNRTLDVSVGGIADVPNLSVDSTAGWYSDASFPFVSEIPVEITSSLVDTDGSEELSLEIQNLLPGVTFNNGSSVVGNKWSLLPADLIDLKMTIPVGLEQDFNMNVVAIATETIGSNTVSTSPVQFSISLREPAINVVDVLGMDMLLAIDNNDITSVTICNNPVGTLYSAGTDNLNGCWTFTPAELIDLMVIPPFTGDTFDFLSLDVDVTYNEGASDLHIIGRLNVYSTEPLTSEVDLQSMDIFTGIDPGDIEFVTVCNVAPDTVFNVGIDLGNGCWKFTQPELDSLSVYFLSDNNTSGEWTIEITFDNGSGTQTISDIFSITSSDMRDAILGDMIIPNPVGSLESYLNIIDLFGPNIK
jgi:large repetitive protein